MNRRQFLAALACVLGFKVLDGDTIDVLVDRKPVRVRLAEIDAPERKQAFGSRSRQALDALVAGQVVTVRNASRDRYNRVLGTIYVGDAAINVNAALVRQGMAWVYRQYSSDQQLLVLEDDARASRRGLWTDPAPVPPWEFRRQRYPSTLAN